MNAIDLSIQNYLTSTRTQEVTGFFYFITKLFDFSLVFFIMLFCLAYLIHRIKGLKYSLLFLYTIFSTVIIVFVLKNIFNTARPLGGLIDVLGGSFPSYHSTMGAVFFVMLMYIFHGSFKSSFAMIFNGFSISFIILVAMSRLYLGVHWLTDVLAGVLLGLVISHIAILIFRRYFKNL